MNEFRKGLRKGFISLACVLDAADEIERLEAERDALRAELDAEREKTADLGKQIDRLADEVDWVEDEVGAQEKALEDVEAELEELRAERDRLRELLRGATAVLEPVSFNMYDHDIREAARVMVARIDTALNKGGGDE